MRATALAFLGVLLLPGVAPAGEPIRVLLYQGAPRLDVRAQSDVVVRLPGGEPRVRASSLVITPLPGAMRVNGEYIGLDRVTIEGGSRDLHVLATMPDPSREQQGEPPWPPAVFLTPPAPASIPEIQSQPVPSPGPEEGLPEEGLPEEGLPEEGLVVGGTLHIVSHGGGLTVINTLDLEEYLMGVIPAEMNAGWHLEALKVQAVASRTYALYQRMIHRNREYDLVATVLDQVYGGRSAVEDRVRQAVEETRGLALTYGGRPILAAFSSTAAGPTENAVNVWSKEVPYLKGVECPFDRNSPYYRWRTAFRVARLEEKLRAQGLEVGTIATVTPYAYSKARRVSKIRILHSLGELILRGEDLRRIVGYRVIPSTRFTIDAVGRDVVLSGYGAGHGVGLCQWGAKELAELGYPFTTILGYYFPGTTLTHSVGKAPVALSMP